MSLYAGSASLFLPFRQGHIALKREYVLVVSN